MPLIKGEKKIEKKSITVRLPVQVKEELDAYCKWAGLPNERFFIIAAVEHVLDADKEWGKVKRK